jgi:hypothetical protein
MSFPPLVTNSSNFVLDAESFKHYIDEFNVFDTEIYSQFIPNVRSWSFLKNNIPLFECPDKEIEKTYYFRWWTYRKHIKYIGDVIPDKRFPFVVTEFMPNVSWAQLHNTIPCAAGHHLREGRWLHDSSYLDSYTRFWFSAFGAPRAYSFWAADSVLAMGLVTGDEELLKKMLPKLVLFHRMMKKTNYDPAARLYFNTDNR